MRPLLFINYFRTEYVVSSIMPADSQALNTATYPNNRTKKAKEKRNVNGVKWTEEETEIKTATQMKSKTMTKHLQRFAAIIYTENTVTTSQT